MCGSSFWVLHKNADSVAPACCVFPGLSGSGSQGLGRPLPGCGAPFPSVVSGPGSQRFGRASPRVWHVISLRGEWPRQPEAWVHSPRMRRAFSLRGPSARRRSGLRKSLDRNRGLFAVWEGVASLGLSLPLAPPPASFLQRGWAGSSLEFLRAIVLRTAGGVFQPVNFFLAVPQFKRAPSDCSPGLPAGPYPKQCRPLLSVSPPLAGGGCGRLGYFSAGSCF